MARAVLIEELDRDDARVVQVATLRWIEWGGEPGSTHLRHWEVVTRAECGSGGLPFTLVATEADGMVVGAVGVVEHDPEGLHDRGPWVVGTVVTADLRSSGVGSALMAALHDRARPFEALWVSTQEAAGFYARCGYQPLAGHDAILYRPWDGTCTQRFSSGRRAGG